MKPEIFKWFLIDKTTLNLTELIFLAMDSSEISQRRFFRKGYLSFDFKQVVYIRESSSVQETLLFKQSSELPKELRMMVHKFLFRTKMDEIQISGIEQNPR